MSENTFENIYPRLDDAAALIKFGRKKIVDSIKHTVTQLEESHSQLSEEVSRGKRDFDRLLKHHAMVTTKYDLVSSLLSAKNTDNAALDRYSQLFNHDFLRFANAESSLREEAQAILVLQAIEKKLQLMITFSGIYNKNIIAVGGGFSAGKSEFISSFFQDKNIKLPIGIKPVTAIPTYIIPAESHVIRGYSQQGGAIDMAPKLYKKLSHDFVKSFAFNLKDIMPVMAIETPLKGYQQLCFVDTPGYNSANTEGFTQQDLSTAEEYLEQSNTLLWVIGLDSQGTFPSSDLAFLERLSLEGKKLYIVANKSDLKSEDDLEDILDNFEDILDDYDIDYEGISAYSSVHQEEIFNRKIGLFEFLQLEDRCVEAHQHIAEELKHVFQMYEDAINRDIQWISSVQQHFKSLELDLLESGYELGDEKVIARLDKMKGLFEITQLKQQSSELEKIRDAMINAANDVLESMVQ